jgi:SOS response regulatory protein OraA/RecX
MRDHAEAVVLTRILGRGRWVTLLFSEGTQIRAVGKSIERYGLAEGDEFTPAEFEKLRDLLEKEAAFFTAEYLLSLRPYSAGEFKRRLRLKEISDDLITAILKEYQSLGLIDDVKYAMMRARSIMERKPAGKKYIVADLQKRLVPRRIAEQTAAELFGEIDEIEAAVRLLEKKRPALAKFDIETARRKAYTYLSRRAISYRTAKAAFERVFGSPVGRV